MNINYFQGATKLSKLSSARQIKYLVFHYTAGTTSKAGTAKNVCSMWNNSSTQASADACVDDSGAWIYNLTPEKSYTWAVGAKAKYNTKGGSLYGIAKNSNCYSIEMCSTNSARKITSPNDQYWSFTEATLNNAAELGKLIMKKYNIPIDRVIRHYDVTGKLPVPTDSSEVLTSSGWVSIKDIDQNSIIMTYDMDSDSLQFSKVDDILTPWNDAVYSCGGFEATYDHRTPFYNSNGEFKVDEWGHIFDSDDFSVLKTSSDYAGCGFTQNISDELKKKSYSWELIELNMSQFDELVNIVFNPDFVVKGEHNLDVIKTVLAIHGVDVEVEKVESRRKNPEFKIKKQNFVKRFNYESGVEERTTEVTCVTVPTGFFLVKQHGNIFITGNCPGVKGWNSDSGSNTAWEAFKKRLVSASTTSTTSTAATAKAAATTVKKEDGLDMTINEFVNSVSNDQSAVIGSKYRASLNADSNPSSWAKESWDKAKEKGVIDGSRPHDIMTREEIITVLNRIGALG